VLCTLYSATVNVDIGFSLDAQYWSLPLSHGHKSDMLIGNVLKYNSTNHMSSDNCVMS